MIAGTHLAFAAALYLGGAALFGYKPDGAGWALVSVAALLPDIDLPTSSLGRLLFWISTRLERRFGHRTLTHSLVGLAAVALLAAPLGRVKPLWFWGVVGGYWSHLWLDMLNRRGVDLFWPSPVRVVTPGRRAWRLEVGSKAEMILLPVLIVATVGLYPLSHLGFRDSLQVLLGNFDIARDDFIHQAGTHRYAVDLTATDSLTLQRIRCRCPVVGVWQRGLIVLYEGQLRAVGQSPVSHDLYPITARLLEGPPLTVVAHKVDMRGRTLRWLLSRLDQSRTYFLLGELDIKSDKVRPVADIALYKPAVYRGNVLTLHYARAGELTPWLNLVAAQGEIYVQFWLKPGDPAVAFTPGEERPVERIPEQLKPFL